MLTGCGNAYESIDVGNWTEVGQAKLPIDLRPGEYSITILEPGHDQMVVPGDLVHARVTVTTGGASNPSEDVWVWTGQEPEASGSPSARAVSIFGGLGSARLRRVFNGRYLGEVFSIELLGAKEHGGDFLPLRGIWQDQLFAGQRRLQAQALINGQLCYPPEWKTLQLESSRTHPISATIKILNLCSAHLLRRTAHLKQKGYVMGWGDSHYEVERTGTLGWTALDADCPAPDGHVRIQAGPFYDHANARDRLAEWSNSYKRLRPPKDFPEEWAECP
jgi:hypothetical protein